MPIQINTILQDVPNNSLLLDQQALLSADMQANPAQHLPGAQPGAIRRLLDSLSHPGADRVQEIKASIGMEDGDRNRYGFVTAMAIRQRKEADAPLEGKDFTQRHLRNLLTFLGMPRDQLEELEESVRHDNNGLPAARCIINIIEAYLAAIFEKGVEANLWPATFWMEGGPDVPPAPIPPVLGKQLSQ